MPSAHADSPQPHEAMHLSKHSGYERLIGTALIDRDWCSALLRDPVATARTFGLAEDDVQLVSDIHAADLAEFARALLPRLYPPWHPARWGITDAHESPNHAACQGHTVHKVAG